MSGGRGNKDRDGASRTPRRVVAIGGGTGLPAVLRGLRRIVDTRTPEAVTAIVTMSDDGGSSGRLRRSMGMPPPGDVRNCLVALAEEEDLLADLFQHRYQTCSELGGHSVGNLILAALSERTGSFLKAVELSSHVLRTVGRILPSTQQDVSLEAILEDGSSLCGESRIALTEHRITRIRLNPERVAPAPGVVEAIRAADLVALGPGSLFTSVLPNIAICEIAAALRESESEVVLVANLVSERGEAKGLSLADHVSSIEKHASGEVVTGVLCNDGHIAPDTLRRYRAEGTTPLSCDPPLERSIPVVHRNLLAPGRKLRHDPEATAAGLVEVWNRNRGGCWMGEAV